MATRRTPTRGRAPALRHYQARTLLALLRGIEHLPGTTFTVLFPRQAGKNEVQAALVAALLSANAGRGGSIVVCAPSFSPQAEISLARLRHALAAIERLFPAAGRPRLSGATVALGRAEAVFLSASPEAHVAGHTASLALIADEAQEIDEEWFDRQFRPMAASTAAPTVLFGTPWNGETLLDRAVAANRLADAAGRAVSGREWIARHHEVGWEEVAASVPRYGEHVRRERDRLGAEHPLFLTQYGLQTVADAGRLLSAAQLAALEGSHERLEGPRAGERYVAGLDIGGSGADADRSVLTVARVAAQGRCEVVALFSWQGEAFATLEAEVVRLARAWRLERLLVDATGIGGPVAERLEAQLPVERLAFTAAAKSELGYALQSAAATGLLALPAAPGGPDFARLRVELAACTARFAGSRQLRWAAPAGAHDDYAVSLALCLRAAASLGPPRVALGRRQ